MGRHKECAIADKRQPALLQDGCVLVDSAVKLMGAREGLLRLCQPIGQPICRVFAAARCHSVNRYSYVISGFTLAVDDNSCLASQNA